MGSNHFLLTQYFGHGDLNPSWLGHGLQLIFILHVFDLRFEALLIGIVRVWLLALGTD